MAGSSQSDRGANSSNLRTPEIDATIGFRNGPPSDAAGDSTRPEDSKQTRDLAFAAVLLAAGHVTERQLAHAIANWTTHGGNSLADHLVAERLITSVERETLEQQASSSMQDATHAATQQGGLSGTQQDRVLLSRLDGDGRLSKLLGVGDGSTLGSDEIVARQVGARYTLLRKLGQGGLGTVWLARDENLRRYVAVKEITGQMDSDDPALSHFRREAEITGRLEHPGIVPVHQFGTDEQTGRAFYAMRFLGKRTLQDALLEYHERREAGNDDPMLRHRLLTAFVNVCQAVAHAHSRKVIHRDLKPENIALDSFGQVVLLDWGLSKINDETGMYDVDGQPEPGDLHSVGTTHGGRVLGTPLYMAPEQAAGRLDDIDERTDVFGLGGILYAILTGAAPHQRSVEASETPSNVSNVLSMIVSEPVKPPQELVPGLPAELNAICLKALATKRYLRYESASQLAEDVQRHMAGAVVSAYETPRKQRIARWMAAHPTATQLLLLFATLTVLGTLAIGWTARRGRVALQEARYAGLEELTRELEVNLRFNSEELAQDIRFITELPLMQAIIATQAGDESSPSVRSFSPGVITDLSEVSPDQWLQRQGSLFEGLLRANPAYLVLVTCTVGDTEIVELVRGERPDVEQRPHLVPKSQLAKSEMNDEVQLLRGQKPGTVLLITGDRLAETVPTDSRSPLVVVAVSPTFDELSGEFFGINAIEFDIRKPLEDLLLAVAPEGVTVLVTDSQGKVAFRYRDGRSTQHRQPQPLSEQYPDLADLFREGSELQDMGDGRRIYARRVSLGGPTSLAEFGIIAIVDD